MNLGFNYLNHVDALRAISVILVILFHLSPEIFSYGYLGVDIFFVISGYVITNSIYKQQIKKGEGIFFFYVKRIKRIFPILFLVIFTFLIAYVLFSPLKGDTNFFLESAISSLVGFSNFYFISNDINYFFLDEINPLLHTWSLGIEEQFYLIYPIFLVLIFRIVKGNTEKISEYLLIFIILSFSIYYFNDGLVGNFYSPIARFWEIAIGCLSFFYPSFSKNKKKIMFLIICILLFFLFFNFHTEKLIQHSNLLITVISFVFITKFKKLKNNKLNMFLEKSYLPYLGKLSYSLYLWHLPVLYFCEIYFSGINLYFIFFITSFSLSVLSYHLYENPLRKSEIFSFLTVKFLKNLHFFVLFFLVIFIFVINNLKVEKNYDYLKKFNYPEQKLKKYLARLDYRYSDYLNAECNLSNYLTQCFKNKNLKNSTYITGDSHADHFLISVDNIDSINPYFYNNFAQCQIISNSIYNVKQLDFFNYCKKKYKKNYEKFIINKLNNTSKNAIIISLRLSDYLSSDWKLIEDNGQSKREVIINNYRKFIQLFPNKKIILLTTVPESKVHTEKCIFNEFLRNKINKRIFDKCHFKKTSDKRRYTEVKSILSEVALKNDNIKIFDPYPLLCPLDTCHNYNKENDFFMLQDRDHLSVEASKFISNNFSLFLKNNIN